MEVLTIFTNDKEILNIFFEFIHSYSKLIKDCEDHNTIFFVNPETNRNEIYYHFLENDIECEFSYNYSLESQTIIKEYFDKDVFYFFDIQFKSEIFLDNMLNDFKLYLNKKNKNTKILVDHPHKGLLKFTPTGLSL